GGTLFLDEIGEIDIPTQVKLLRVLAERSIERVGSNTSIPVNVRVIAATNRNLEAMVKEGTFRLDLYQRLNVISLHLPPLRERKGDIVLMAHAFARELSQQNNREPKPLSRPALELLRAFDWPGNVRQLRTAVEHAVVMSSTPELLPADLPEYLQVQTPTDVSAPTKSGSTDFELATIPSLNLQYIEQQVILMALQRTGGNRSAAAELLGINRRTLQRKLADSPQVFKHYT
ncbi:MAG: sigma 54-interacting transcriptional regulator, partial [Akkermansia sp.]|nr:sigma 54-interacting transcriptional regulator [Akkermansia sp.]